MATWRNLFLVVLQGEIEGRTFAQLSLGPDPAAVALDDALNNGKAYAGAFKFLAADEVFKYSRY